MAEPLHPVIRRAILLLSGSYALMWAAISMTAGPGPSALVTITGDAAHAGLFFAVFSLAAAGGAASGGRLMDRFGRRPVLVGAHLLAGAGYATVGWGVRLSAFTPFVIGLVALAGGTGAAYLTRVAAAELFPNAQRGRGMAWVLLGAAAGALLGPALLVATGGRGLEGVWMVAAPMPMLAALVVLIAPEPMRIARDIGRYHPAAPAAPRVPAGGAVKGAFTLVAAIATLAVVQMAMVGLMGVAGAWLGHAGHGVEAMGMTMALHFVGMFAFSPVAGMLADRWGRRPTIVAGLLCLASGALVIGNVPGLRGFATGLFLVGLGWSFAYVGASVLLTDATPLERRARVIGRADLGASLAAAAAASTAGVWYAAQGLPGLGLAGAAILVVPLVVVLLYGRPVNLRAAA